MSKKMGVIIVVVLFNFLVFSPASAQVDNTSQLPELNPFCWHRKDCHEIRKNFLISNPPSCTAGDPSCKELEQGFITTGVAPCEGGTGAEQWGRCLPAGKTKTEISFGGKDEFNNIGDFLVVMYKYLLTIASIVAVVVIIIAGAQWITSGGNSEAISSAKKRIGGAIIGLFIAYMSYFVLNTINPALVNLRLPQVWLVKPQSLTPEFCSDLEKPGQEGKIKYMLGASQTDQAKPLNLENADGKTQGFTFTKPETFYCGSRFFVASGGSLPCRGRYCSPENGSKKGCFNKSGDRKNYECGDAVIYGNISSSVLIKGCGHFFLGDAIKATGLSSPWGCPPILDSWIVISCENPSPLLLVQHGLLTFGTGHGEESGNYWIESKRENIESDVMHRCDAFGGIKGFAVGVEMYNELSAWDSYDDNKNRTHLIGRDGQDLGQGGLDGSAYGNMYKVDKKFLFEFDEIMEGVRLDIDAAKIDGASGVTEENKSYWEARYQNE